MMNRICDDEDGGMGGGGGGRMMEPAGKYDDNIMNGTHEQEI